ncbi:HepT-like ribonuclease domain-containing protein [Allorhizobium pseudoryzae]|uniref:HepT-like ribonuclease domain-containing protein n=1 Tax=Allorhizobium pseudoryzae TaxID=379684 RepID=UPI003D095375
MARDIRHFLYDISHTIRMLEAAVADKTFADYQSDFFLKLGAERAIEIISEASRRIPEDLQNLHPDIPWPKIRGIGNILRHEYYGLSEPIIWGVIKDELPKLGIAVAAIQAKLDED